MVLGGYPGVRRSEQTGVVEFDFVSFIGRVTQASEDHIALQLDIPNSYWPQETSLGECPDLGGASGGPVFRIRSTPIEMIEYVGVVYEYSQEFELVFARHAVHVPTIQPV